MTQNAIKAAGGGAKLARALKLTRQAVYQWNTVPVQHIGAVETLSGIPRHKLRPDLYPQDRERL